MTVVLRPMAAVLAAGSLLAGCAGFSTLASFEDEASDVLVEGVSYRVSATPTEGGFDVHSQRNQAMIVVPDQATEQKRNLAAVMQVAARLCRGQTPTIAQETREGGGWHHRVRCG